MRKATVLMLVGLVLAACMDSQLKKPDTVGANVGPGDVIGGVIEVVDDIPEVASEAADPTDEDVGSDKIQPPVAAQKAPEASPRLSLDKPALALRSKITSRFDTRNAAQIYIQTDKPLYRPGESVWIRTWVLQTRDLAPGPGGAGVLYQLVSPKGAVVMEKRVKPQTGPAAITNDFELPEGVPGGEYLIRVTNFGKRVVEEKPIIISNYEPPRIKKKLEFVHKAYGPGDEVSATLEVKRPTGEPLSDKTMAASIRLDGQTLAPVTFRTNTNGAAVVRFDLPEQISVGDGLLTILVEDGGITESISRRVPIVLKKIRFKMFPEGGKLVRGLPGRVYFEAQNTMSKPADVRGRIVDDKGRQVATFASVRDGLGRFDITPQKGRSYFAEFTAPAGIKDRFELGGIADKGCALSSFDDYDGQIEAIRVQVHCTEAKAVALTAFQREQMLETAHIKVSPGKASVVYLKSDDEALNRAQGIARVTLWEGDAPLAERLVYRNRRNSLQIKIQPTNERLAPRDQAELSIHTTDSHGDPVSAALALSVVDDTVISFADDKTGHMLSRIYLAEAIPTKIEEPNFYFDLTEKNSAQAMDLLMGTKGFRRFEWKAFFNPPPKRTFYDFDDVRIDGALVRPEGAMIAPRLALGAEEAAAEADPAIVEKQDPAEAPEVAQGGDEADEAQDLDEGAEAEREMNFDANNIGRNNQQRMRRDRDWDNKNADKPAMAWAPVRVFPVPDHKPGITGPRTDFRDTIFWAPEVKTDEKGLGSVRFPLSDAVTSFRVFAEGVGASTAGRNEAVFKSSLPFSMSVKLPLEVSVGDSLRLPLTLTNERDEALQVKVEASFGDLVAFAGAPEIELTIPAKGRKSLIYPVQVTGDKAGRTEVAFKASAGNLHDEFKRAFPVVPVGFPQAFSAGGQLENGKDTHELDLGEAVEGTIQAKVKFYPSPVATMVEGMEGMLRQPGGCFEQASSTNYPNLMVMRYLKEHHVDSPELWQRAGSLMDSGYRLLTGYESKKKGYEWFGGDPGHEALTAYGLMEFADMKAVWSGVDENMIARTAAWLRSRRDGKGGYERNARALDSFGRASKAVTDAYITYALVEGGFSAESKREIQAQADAALKTTDPYLLALATNTLLNAPGFEAKGRKAAARLASLQHKDGAWQGADHSVTRSGGENLVIETTALAVMGLLKAGSHPADVLEGVRWLNGHRSGFGQWGATQATVLTLKALTRYANSTRQAPAGGSITVIINGEVSRELVYKKGHKDTIVIEGLEAHLGAGRNRIEVIHEGKKTMPYSVLVEYRSVKPATSDEATIDLSTSVDKTEVGMGEVVRLTATVTNKTDKGQPMTLARVGLPGGLTFQTWQLKELKDKGLIGFYETQPREVILYLRDMKPGEVKTLPLDLVATVPGRYQGPASSAYLYYTDEHKTWRGGLPITVR